EKVESGGAGDFVFYNGDTPITSYSFGTVTVPESKDISLKVKNIGSEKSSVELNIMPNQVFVITNNGCKGIELNPDGTCTVKVKVMSLNRIANNYASKLIAGNNSMDLKAFVYTPNKCSPGTHLDPDSLSCLGDIQTEVVANGV